MNRGNLIFQALLVGLSVVSVAAFADTPTMISYQGYLSQDGSPVPDATYTVQFRIYDGSSTELWMEEHQVETDGGHFTVLLGSLPGSEITADLFGDDDRYLGITVESQSEMVPRVRLVTQPYAFHVATVDGASGGTINGTVTLQSDESVELRLEADQDNFDEAHNPRLVLSQDGGAVTAQLGLNSDNDLEIMTNYPGIVDLKNALFRVQTYSDWPASGEGMEFAYSLSLIHI